MKRVLGVDYGTKRVGLAISDGIGLTARPLEVVDRPRLLDRIRQIAQEHELQTIVIGLPTSLSGNEGESARGAREMGDELGGALGIEVVYVDERYTSRMAEGALLESGMKRQVRKETVDKVAAAIILQTYLDRASPDGNSPGDPGVEPPGIQ